VKCSKSLSKRVSNIIRRYIDHIKFASYMAFLFIASFHVVLIPFLSLYILLYIWLYVLYTFVNYVFLLLRLCILIVLYVLFCIFCFHCVVLCIVCV
jgi:hypothetical protein